MPRARAHRQNAAAPRFRLRLATLVGVTLVVVAAALLLIRPQTIPSAAADSTAAQSVGVTMMGFQPSHLQIAAGQPMHLRLVNPDSPYHTDGGGVHQFAVPELGVDVKVPPRSTLDVTIPAAKAGTYTFYCDVCCGGKENPSMQGTITVS